MKTLPTPKQQIIDLLDTLSLHDQQRVLDFIHALTKAPQGIPAQEFIDFIHESDITAEEAENMQRIFEELGL